MKKIIILIMMLLIFPIISLADGECIDDFKTFLEAEGRSMITGEYTLCPNMEFNITPDGDYDDYGYWTALFYMDNSNTILNCNGSTIYMDRDYYGFVEINTQSNIIQNCNFERRYTEMNPEGCNCISDVTIKGMVYNTWFEPENPFYDGSIESSAYSKLINCTFENSTIGDMVSLNTEMSHDIEIVGNTFNNIYLRGNFNFHDNSFYELLPFGNNIWYSQGDIIWDSLAYNINGENYVSWRTIEIMNNTEIYNSSFKYLYSYNSSSFNIHDNNVSYSFIKGQNIIIIDNVFTYLLITSFSNNFSVEKNRITTLIDYTNYSLYNVSFCLTDVGNYLTTYIGNNVYELGTCHVPSFVSPSQLTFNPVLALFYVVCIMSLGTLFIMYRFTILKNGDISMVEFVIECCLIMLGIFIVSILLL